jgi:hypothetical protein
MCVVSAQNILPVLPTPVTNVDAMKCAGKMSCPTGCTPTGRRIKAPGSGDCNVLSSVQGRVSSRLHPVF